MRTLLITFLGGLTLLAAIAGIIVVTGTTRISEALTSPAWEQASPFLVATLAVLVAVSAMTKSAQFPFHSWLPDAMAAATPVSAYLHAAAVVKAGIFLLIRFSPASRTCPRGTPPHRRRTAHDRDRRLVRAHPVGHQSSWPTRP